MIFDLRVIMLIRGVPLKKATLQSRSPTKKFRIPKKGSRKFYKKRMTGFYFQYKREIGKSGSSREDTRKIKKVIGKN